MVSLPSSGEKRIRHCVQALVIALVKQSGDVWSEICEVRRRRGIHAITQVPPVIYPSSVHVPDGQPENVPAGEEGHEEWCEFSDTWMHDLNELHDRIVPEECRDGHVYHSRHTWRHFLSACLLYDPPDDRLEEYASRRAHYRTGLRGTRYEMAAAPIRHMRDAGAAEDAWVAVLNRILGNLVRLHRQEPEKDLEEHIRETFRSEAVDYLGPVREYHDKNPALPFIEVQPWHRENDVREAFRMIRDVQTERPRRGQPNRDQLQAVQCAIFADRYGWTEEQVGKHYGWTNYGKAGKYIRRGRHILNTS
jgi:hypothetical protein